MHPLTAAVITRATVNATRSEAAAITVPRDFADVPWSALDFYGWRDPRIERRGYLVTDHRGAPATVLLTTTGARPTGRKAMCSLCRAVDDGPNIALFAARRAGPAGRKGDTVGTYICTGLDCSAQLRIPVARAGREHLPDGHLSPDERAAAMMARLDAFLDAVG